MDKTAGLRRLYRPKVGRREDRKPEVVIEFDYSTPDGRQSTRWRRSKGWNRSFLGRKSATPPERPVYLRTLSNLSNPSEVRGVLSMSRLSSAPRETPLTASQIEFAQQMLPFRYAEVVNLSSGTKNLLFAAQERGAEYSELHMAAGEGAILRLSREIAQLDGALVLIDEVESRCATADRPGATAKTKLHGLAEPLGWTESDIGRVVARLEAARKESDIQPLLEGLKGALLKWRAE